MATPDPDATTVKTHQIIQTALRSVQLSMTLFARSHNTSLGDHSPELDAAAAKTDQMIQETVRLLQLFHTRSAQKQNPSQDDDEDDLPLAKRPRLMYSEGKHPDPAQHKIGDVCNADDILDGDCRVDREKSAVKSTDEDRDTAPDDKTCESDTITVAPSAKKNSTSTEADQHSSASRDLQSLIPGDGRLMNQTGTHLSKKELPASADLSAAATLKARQRTIYRVRATQKLRKGTDPATNVVYHEVVDIADFFFSKLLGRDALCRLSSLIGSYNPGSCEIPPTRDDDYAMQAVQDPENPVILRPFLYAYSKATRHKGFPTTLVRHVHQIEDELAFLAEYGMLQKLAEGQHPALLQLLRDHDVHANRSQTVVRYVNMHVIKLLQTRSEELSDFVQSVKAIEVLVRQFSRGVIIILPPRSSTPLTKWGVENMKNFCRIFGEEVPGFRALCECLRDNVLDHILMGTRLPFAHIETKGGQSIQQRLDQAIRRAQSD